LFVKVVFPGKINFAGVRIKIFCIPSFGPYRCIVAPLIVPVTHFSFAVDLILYARNKKEEDIWGFTLNPSNVIHFVVSLTQEIIQACV
jgi:hypothetical protein